jgi:hypothetical protein
MANDLWLLYWDFLVSKYPATVFSIKAKNVKGGSKIILEWRDDFNNRWNATYALLYDFTRNFRLEE